MFKTSITFLVPIEGLPSWHLQHLKKLTLYFKSQIVLFNFVQNRQVDMSDVLRSLTMVNKPNDLCQIVIEGSDAELACMVFTEAVREHSNILSTSCKQHSLSAIQKEPALNLPFSLSWHYAKNQPYQNKQDVLQTIANLATNENPLFLYEQLSSRENISSTGLPNGIAIPHAMSPCVHNLTLVVLPLLTPIHWSAHLSQPPISLSIALLLPEGSSRDIIMSSTHLTRWLLDETHGQQMLVYQREESLYAACRYILSTPYRST